MSDNYLRLIPTDAHFVPTECAVRSAVAFLRPSVPAADNLEVETYARPIFVDQGTNLEAIRCPRCGTTSSLHGPDGQNVQHWWNAITDSIDEHTVTELVVTMPCCTAEVPFANLSFEWPAGIASFEISILNPGVSGLDERLVAKLEHMLGCKLRQIWAHY